MVSCCDSMSGRLIGMSMGGSDCVRLCVCESVCVSERESERVREGVRERERGELLSLALSVAS